MTQNAPAHLDVHWDDVAILNAAGVNPETVFALLERNGQTREINGEAHPTNHAIYQWNSRRKIADTWRAPLIYSLLSEEKIHIGKLFRIGSVAKKQISYHKAAA